MSPTPASAAARDRYLDDFRRVERPGPVWLAQLRARAIDAFAARGFPDPKDESWRFTSVAPVLETSFRPAPPPGPGPDLEVDRWGIASPGSLRLVFVNGRPHPGLSTVSSLPRGVHCQPLAAAWASLPALVEPHLASVARYDEQPFAALSTAFLEDGAFVHVPAGVELAGLIEVLFLTVGTDGPQVVHPRLLVVLERGARAAVVETYASTGNAGHFTNAVTELVIGEGAQLEHCRIQREGPRGYHLAVSQSRQGRDSRVESCSVALGGALARHDIGAVLDGPGGWLTLNGLTVARDQQHVDHHTVIDHAQPHCESHELFNGIFDERARGVFNGRIIVRPGAQRTDSKQTSNNLLLSEDARADSQPQLEIYADDVKCTHGATLGPVDDASLFYLRSRGLDRQQARALLTYGFGADVIGRVRRGDVRAHLDRLLQQHLPGSALPA
jgi:Fe-S cluster assembly protein SufD